MTSIIYILEFTVSIYYYTVLMFHFGRFYVTVTQCRSHGTGCSLYIYVENSRW